jgi:hypothetical protein
MKLTMPSTATLRRIGAAVISVYGLLSLKDVAPHLPTWVAGLMVAAAPVMEALQHYLDHPSTGTTEAVSSAQANHLNALTQQVYQESNLGTALNGPWTYTGGTDPGVRSTGLIDPLTGQPKVATSAPPAPTPQP